MSTPRKIIQCWSETNGSIDESCTDWGGDARVNGDIYSNTFCLCNDGTIWEYSNKHRKWECNKEMSNIPQGEVE